MKKTLLIKFFFIIRSSIDAKTFLLKKSPYFQ